MLTVTMNWHSLVYQTYALPFLSLSLVPFRLYLVQSISIFCSLSFFRWIAQNISFDDERKKQAKNYVPEMQR